jgi:NAD(P)-dependent dehydrogenase (short-subunit alcohol dehydrogenase family)
MNTQVVLITGGLTGIGRATALAFAKEGAQVVVSGRRDEEGQKLVSEIRKAGAEAEFIHADVRREEDVRNLIDKTVERFGRLDVAVNTAGTEGVPGPITEQTADSYAATFDTNVLGTLLSMKHELRVMLPQKKRQHREHILHIWAYRRAWGFCLFRQQACGGGTH